MCFSSHQYLMQKPIANLSCLLHYAPDHCSTCLAYISSTMLLQSRKVAHVPFTTGFSQGEALGPLALVLLSLTLHFGIHITPQQFSSIDDSCQSLWYPRQRSCTWPSQLFGTHLCGMKLILKDYLHLDINVTKSNLIVLQLNTIANPECDFTHVTQKCPDLCPSQ